MVIYRLAPGDIAPWTGTYRLVEHYGEQTDRRASVERGDPLPLVEIAGDSELWFVLEEQGEAIATALVSSRYDQRQTAP